MLNIPRSNCEKCNVQMRKYLTKAENRDTSAISMVTRITSRNRILRNWEYIFSFALISFVDLNDFAT